MAAWPTRAQRNPAFPSPLWPVLCSAVLVGIMIASGVRRMSTTRADHPATGAFGTIRSTDEPVAVQHERAQESGWGRQAQAPRQTPWQGWKDIVWRTYKQIGEDRSLAVAAGVVFSGLLAIFPAVTALVSLYGLFASPSAISEQLSFLAGILPQGAVDILREQIGRVTTGSGAKLGLGFIFGLAVALWSANAGMKAIMDALNVVYEEKEKRGFIKLNLISLAFTITAIASLLVALGAVVVIPVALSYLGLQNVTELLLRLARWSLLLLVVIFGLAVLYRYGPSRREPRWQWISVGSAFAAIAWLISSALLSWYLASFADYNATYGSLGAGIGMMMWMWISAIVILFGAQLNSEIEHQTARDSTVQG
jgi:membrane protein